MIAYLIQVHSRLSHLPKLLEWIYHPENVYLFSLDSRSISIDEARSVIPARDNVHLIECPPCTWAGESLLMAMLEGTRVALKVSSDWTHIAHVSESCFPLKTQADLMQYVRDQEKEGFENFLFYSEPVVPRFTDAETYTGEMETVLSTRPGVAIRSDVALNRFFSDVANSPIIWTDLRPSIHSTEVAPGIIHCRPLHPVEAAARSAYFGRHPYRAGRSNCMLSRASCEWLLTSMESLTCLEYVKTTMAPEETFFMTALMSHASPASSCTVPHSLHYNEGGPETIDDSQIEKLRQSDRFFARKLASTGTSRLYQWMDEMRYRS